MTVTFSVPAHSQPRAIHLLTASEGIAVAQAPPRKFRGSKEAVAHATSRMCYHRHIGLSTATRKPGNVRPCLSINWNDVLGVFHWLPLCNRDVFDPILCRWDRIPSGFRQALLGRVAALVA